MKRLSKKLEPFCTPDYLDRWAARACTTLLMDRDYEYDLSTAERVVVEVFYGFSTRTFSAENIFNIAKGLWIWQKPLTQEDIDEALKTLKRRGFLRSNKINNFVTKIEFWEIKYPSLNTIMDDVR